MGWTGGTDIFDNVMTVVLSRHPTPQRVIKAFIAALEAADWDTQDESRYWDNETVRAARRELHPEDFDEEGNEVGAD